jgi:hypothetical protein
MTLFAWGCDSHLHRPQKLKVYLHSTRPEHEIAKMARADQGLQDRSALSSEKAKYSCGRAES